MPIVWLPQQGLVIDEICFRFVDIDDTKAVLDMTKTRDVHCRNKNGSIPKLTAKILCTNWKHEVFWPAEARLPEHQTPIERRHKWVDVIRDLRLSPSDAAGPKESHSRVESSPSLRPATGAKDAAFSGAPAASAADPRDCLPEVLASQAASHWSDSLVVPIGPSGAHHSPPAPEVASGRDCLPEVLASQAASQSDSLVVPIGPSGAHRFPPVPEVASGACRRECFKMPCLKAICQCQRCPGSKPKPAPKDITAGDATAPAARDDSGEASAPLAFADEYRCADEHLFDHDGYGTYDDATAMLIQTADTEDVLIADDDAYTL